MQDKILIATEKPFSESARNSMVKMFEEAGLKPLVLEKYKDPKELLSAMTEAAAVVVRSDKITREVLDAGKGLKLVVRAGAGYDNIDCAAAKERKVIVENTPGQNSNAVAELAMGLMIMIARGKYSGKSGTELKGKSLGVHALGNIGKIVATLGKAFGMEVCAFDPFVEQCVFEECCAAHVRSIEDLYSSNDYISLHIPATPQTVKSINYALLSRMKKGGTLVNTARAEVIHEEDLLRIMGERPDIQYASDIAPKNSAAFLEKCADRVFFTPKKMGAETAEANANAGMAAAGQIIAFFKEGKILNQVNA
jgi:D-3-phosphoglycerate dehydrogenase / 2-oxoglutarate reductase